MFYSKEIITRKDSNLGLIWIAATMGARSVISKLSKKEVNGVNIVQICKDISQPAEPFALRFSSNLMVGVTRVYNQQYAFYYSDVNNTWIRLKRDLAVVQSENLDMVNPGVKLANITSGYNLDIEHDIVRPAKLAQDLELEVARGGRQKDVAIEFGWATHSAMSLGDSQSDNVPSLSDAMFIIDTSDERRRRITLDEQPKLTGPASAFDFGEDFLIAEDNGLYIDADGNLIDYLPEGFHGLDESTLEPMVPEAGELNVKRKRESEEGTGWPGSSVSFDQGEQYVPMKLMDVLNVPFDHDGQGMDLALDAELMVPLLKRSRIGERQRKAVELVIDNHTMLTREEIIDARDNFLQNQAKLIRERDTRQEIATARARIDRFLIRPLGVTNVGPDLDAFWNTASAHTNIDVSHGDSPLLSAGIFNADQDIIFLGEELPEPEVRRRDESLGSGGTPAGANIAPFGVSSTSSSRPGGSTPWASDLHTNVDYTTGSDRPWNDFEMAFDQATDGLTRRHRSNSVGSLTSLGSGSCGKREDTPLTRRRRTVPEDGRPHSQDRSRGTSRGLDDGHGGGSGPGSSLNARDLFMDIDELAEGMGGQQVEAPSTTQDHQANERETTSFLKYVRSLLKDADANLFLFSDVVAGHRRRDIAASAFYHVLGKNDHFIVAFVTDIAPRMEC
ncbi:hypothetical protein BGZ50_008661 [Haplosporangium sp. Z 11]|nr:hypothetical protein BGZ50_008661 [Haplosporangium sp. Z 11]